MSIKLSPSPPVGSHPELYPETKKKWREQNRDRHAATRNHAKNDRRRIRRFVGFDGEGMARWCLNTGCECKQYVPSPVNELSPCTECRHQKDSHYHAYVLLGIGNQYIDTETLGIDEITWEETFEFAYSEYLKPANRDCVFCGFFLSYDFNNIIKSIPRDRAWKLYNCRGNLRNESDRKSGSDKRPVSPRKPLIATRERAEGKPYPVALRGKRASWEFDTLDERQIRLRPFNCGCADTEYHRKHCTLQGCSADHHLLKKFCKWETGEVTAPGWMYVNDVGSFFQKSFLAVINPEDWALKDCPECRKQPCFDHDTAHCAECKVPACPDHAIVTREEYLTIKRGKENRENAVLDDETRYYNKLENLILARVMEKFREGLNHFGIFLDVDKWYGPGAAAGEWIRIQGQNAECATRNAKGIVTNDNNPLTRKNPVSTLDKIVEKAGRASYIAGWFEIFAHGHVPGDVWEYDINSAYPAVITDLPCMAHGQWEMGFSGGKKLTALPKGAAFRLVHATVTGSDPYIGAMLHRDSDNNICRPHKTHSWYWQDELEAALNANLIDSIAIGCTEEACRDEYKYGGAVTLTYYPRQSCGKLCSGMAELYQERLRVGKNTPMGKGAKLVYNSAYGKFAQLIGTPQWASNIYASRITSGCRKKILSAIETHPEGSKAVVMIATDGIYFTSRHPVLPVSPDQLGLWEEKITGLTLFKPGVYWHEGTRDKIRKGQAPQFKSRGVSAKKFGNEIVRIDDMFSQWNSQFPDDEKGWPSVTFNSGFAQVTCKQALMRGKWETAGKVTISGRVTQNSFPDGKRSSILIVDNTGQAVSESMRIIGEYDTEYGLYRSNPRDVSYIVSKPRAENQTNEYMKNEGDMLESVTPDGTLTDTFAGILDLRG